ncbi:DUF1566 domain-containing protein [candidate division KSB1 bacterium]|nr:DUF1566 domain-containing protein [candidate division KSB1 bacterium]
MLYYKILLQLTSNKQNRKVILQYKRNTWKETFFMTKTKFWRMITIVLIVIVSNTLVYGESYKIVDTGQIKCFDNSNQITPASVGSAYYGQDAQYSNFQPSYTDNGDGTVTDNVTGLVWEKGYIRCDYDQSQALALQATTGGYTDWRVPTIKELFSLINFTGNEGSGNVNSNTPPSDAVPFINTKVFDFDYPSDPTSRYIDVQFISSTEYVGTVMSGMQAFFGVNFADGRIKGYPQSGTRGNWYLRLVRAGDAYGVNNFSDNGDGTITDSTTGLMWSQEDSGSDIFNSMMSQFIQDDGTLNWQEALEFAETVEFAGYSDWRLPNVKELQSIVGVIFKCCGLTFK